MRFLIFFLLTILLCSCSGEKTKEEENSEEDFLVEEGFVINTVENKTGKKTWFFVSAKNIRKKDWRKDFITSNLGDGFQFHEMGHPNFPISYIEKHLDTIFLENKPDQLFHSTQLRLFPVKIKYKFYVKRLNPKLDFTFEQDLGGQVVQFNYNGSRVQIYDVIPFAEPKWPITECQCERKEEDVNGYLYKICLFQKERESKYSDIPCSYGIRSIEKDSLEGKEVIKINLTCCYMGDDAYIDPETGEVIEVHYSPI